MKEGRSVTAENPVARALRRIAYRSGEALGGQLRSVVRLAAVPAGGDPEALKEAAATGRPLPRGGGARLSRTFEWAHEQAATLRANIDFRSEAFRHGVRLGAALVLSVWLSHLFKQGHRYWLPLTVMIVLKPDFSSTFTRGVSRVLGTLVGAGLVTVAVAELRPGHAALIAIVIVLYFAAIGLLFANYAIYSVCIASLVVTLLAFTGQPEVSLAGDRSLYTVLGAAVALVAYVAWPTWAAASIQQRLSTLFGVEGRYGSEVLAAWADPSAADRGRLQRSRLDARLARTNAEAAVERWLDEPSRAEPIRQDAALGALAAMRAYVQAVLSLHARLPTGDSTGWPEARQLSEQVGEALTAAAEAVAGGPRRRLPPLRDTQLKLRQRAGVDVEPDGAELDREAILLVGETDQVVNSLNTLGHLVGLNRRD